MSENKKKSKIFILTIILFALTSSYSFAQYPSENFTLLSQYIPGSGSALDVDFIENYALILDGSVLEIVDISNLENPILYKRINSVTGRKIIVREIETSIGLNNYAFVKANYGLEIIDLKSINDIPIFNTFYLNDIVEYDIRNNLMYVVLDSSFQIYDLSTIANYSQPTLIKQINTTNKNYGLTIDAYYIYLGQEKGLGVVDIINVDDIELVAEVDSFEYECTYNMWNGNGVIKDNYLIVNGLNACFQFFMFDISNPTSPAIVDYSPIIYGSLDITSFTIDKEYLYYTVIPNQGGLYSISMSDPMSPLIVGNFRNISKAGGASVKTRDNIVYYCGYMNTEAYPMNQQGGLFILKNDLITTIEKYENLFMEFNLSQNYPNPFNPSTKIKYTIPAVDAYYASTTMVILKVYDVLGKVVATLVNKELSAGSYEVEFRADGLSSGLYFYRLRTGGFIETKKMILLR